MYIHTERGTGKLIKTRFKEWMEEIIESMPTRKWTDLSTGKTYTTDLAQQYGRIEFEEDFGGRVKAVVTFDIGFTEFNDCVSQCKEHEFNCYSDDKDPNEVFWSANPYDVKR